jgi:hypothetical protein
MAYNGRQYKTCQFETQTFKLKNKFDMKVEVTITDDAGNIRQYVVSGMLPTDEEIINEAEGRYPVKTHNNPDKSPYVGTQKTFIHGVRWALAFVQGNYR